MHNSSLKARPEPTSEELRKQAHLLKKSRYFVGTGTSELELLWEKQLIFLVLAGMKPVSEVYSCHWVDVPKGQEAVGDNLSEVRGFLDTLGLAHYVFDSDGTTMAVVARVPQLVQDYVEAEQESRRGLLFGYPATAVQAFVAGDSLMETQQDQFLQAEGLPNSPFALSREHYRGEIALLHRWQDILRSYGLSGDTIRRRIK